MSLVIFYITRNATYNCLSRFCTKQVWPRPNNLTLNTRIINTANRRQWPQIYTQILWVQWTCPPPPKKVLQATLALSFYNIFGRLWPPQLKAHITNIIATAPAWPRKVTVHISRPRGQIFYSPNHGKDEQSNRLTHPVVERLRTLQTITYNNNENWPTVNNESQLSRNSLVQVDEN